MVSAPGASSILKMGGGAEVQTDSPTPRLSEASTGASFRRSV